MADELMILCLNNLDFYQKVKSNNGVTFVQNFEVLIKNIQEIIPVVTDIECFAGDYDLDEETRGNGYRSFIYVYESAVNRTAKVCKYVNENRESIFFRKSFYEKEIGAYSDLFQSLDVMGCSLVEIHNNSVDASLYTEEGIYENAIKRTMDSTNMKSFYGRVLGFHLPESLQVPTKLAATFTATYSEHYYSNDNKILKLLRAPYTYLKYLFNSELLSHRLVEIFENAECSFNKSLLLVCESKVYGIYQELSEHKVTINEVFCISPDPLQIYSENHGKIIDIPVPNSHIGVKPITCRLLSSTQRKGMIKAKNEAAEPSKSLIIHCHGGGWTTQSSKFHGSYLREWAVKLEVPILSVDYSLAPEAPFPRAIEEVFYAYCWALKNPELLGWTGEKVVLVGDSAGGNLVTACVIKCIEMGIRKPTGLCTIYSVFLANYVTAPSRFLGFMDIILSYNIYVNLFPSYIGNEKETIKEKRQVPKPTIKKVEKLSQHHLMSPHYAVEDILSEFPPTKIISANLDPCLDECVEFARKLKKLGVAVQLDVLEGLCHGFLNLSQMSKESHRGSRLCMQRIVDLLELNE